MKIKNTIILLGVFVFVLLFILFLDKKGPADKTETPEEKLVALAAADIQKITFKKETETLIFAKDDKGDWMMLEPLEAKADKTEVSQLVDGFADLKIERVIEKESTDLKRYQIPLKEVSIWVKGQDNPVKILIGQENPLGNTFYAQKDGDKRIVLLPSTLKTALDKKLFDFRQKDIFKFETADAASIKLQSKEAAWEAVKKDGEWFFQKPFKARAKDSKITDLLGTLSNQRAKEFVAEAKKAEDLKKTGLDKPEYQVTLSLPKDNKELVFVFHKTDDKTYVTTSQSTKIIVPEIEPLADLDRKPADLRENKVVTFNTWQASKVGLKKDGLSLTLTKASNDKWYFDAAQKEEADASKIDTFVRKIESLEAAEYVDAPKGLAEYGLDKPQAEVTVWTKESGEKPVEKSFTVLIGKEDKDKKLAVLKNARLDYFFRVDSAFLTEFPKEAKDWKAPEPEKKEPEKK